MPPELSEVRAWLDKVDRDRRTAEAALAQTPPITDTAAFHVQQAVEKALKAFLVWRQIDFEKTHDLRALVLMCQAADPEFGALLPKVAPLSAYAVRFRYPGPADPSLAEVRAGLEIVREVRDFVGCRLPPALRA